MALLLETNSLLVDSLTMAVGVPVTPVSDLVSLRRALTENPAEDLVVIGPEVGLEVALEFAAGERVARPSLGVVLVRGRLDTATLTQALRAGVREVIKADELPSLLEACNRSLALSRQVRGLSAEAPASATGTVITVFSAKGGCGKTTLATNIGAVMADGGKRKVCILDLDLAFGDVAIALHLFPNRTLADAVPLARSLDRQAVEGLVTNHSPGLDVLVAPLEPGTADSISAALVTKLLQLLKGMYDVVLVDTPPAFTDPVLAAFDVSEHLVLLATLDVPAVKNLKLTIETLTMLGFARDRCHAVLNRADAKVGLTVEDVAKTLGAEIAAEIPSSRSVPASVNRGVALVLDEPGHAVSVAIRRFADRHLPLVGVSVPAQPRRDRRGFSLLRRAAG